LDAIVARGALTPEMGEARATIVAAEAALNDASKTPAPAMAAAAAGNRGA
jgi:hypothetical protein